MHMYVCVNQIMIKPLLALKQFQKAQFTEQIGDTINILGSYTTECIMNQVYSNRTTLCSSAKIIFALDKNSLFSKSVEHWGMDFQGKKPLQVKKEKKNERI